MASVKKAVEVLVLGFLAEKPSHAYHLRKSIEWSVGHIQRVSDGMLYPLLRELNEQGLISGSMESTENAPDKRVYRLKEAGKRRLQALMTGPLECTNFDDKIDFYARYAMFSHLSPAERRSVLQERLSVCDSALGRLAEATEQASNDPYRLELLKRAVNTIENECEWLLAQSLKESGEMHENVIVQK
ncbi:MAG: PadR family transcriptional regulator [Actinobacteria bacterium]|nr:PadR family transcriptional regulator [Actinomycetota bacterium]